MNKKSTLNVNPNILFENKYESTKLLLKQIMFYTMWGLIAIFSIHIILIFKFGMNDTIMSILSLAFGWWYPIIMGSLVITASVITPINNFFFSEPKVDTWMVDLAYDRIDSEVVLYYRNKLFFSYGSSYNSRDIQDFILDINKRSESYNYYLLGIDSNNSLFSVESEPKIGLPNEIDNERVYDKENEIHLGVLGYKDIDDFVWDYKNKNDDYANSILAIGPYGSGKNNLHNVILSHLDKIDSQILLINNYNEPSFVDKIQNVKSYSKSEDLSVSDFKSLQDIMYSRINYSNSKNRVKYYKIASKYLQFDEILHVFHNNESKYMYVEDVYTKLSNGESIELIE